MRRDDWLLAQLPMGMLEDDFFTRFVGIFQEVASTYLDDVDNLDHLVDPTVSPTPFVPYLGSWIGVQSIDPSLPDDLQRRIVRETSSILAWRGTYRGLVQFLELVCEGEVSVTETGGVFREGQAPATPARIEIHVETIRWATVDDFVALVLDELPASVPASIVVGGELVWPTPDQAVAS
ncbi:MAG: phage tail protein [Acidimicrobiales bacterium]